MKTTMYCSGHPLDGDKHDFNSGWMLIGYQDKFNILNKFKEFVRDAEPHIISEEIKLLHNDFDFENKFSSIVNFLAEINVSSYFHLDIVIHDENKYLDFINKFRVDPRIRDIVLKYGTKWDFGRPYASNYGLIAEIGISYKSAFEREFILNALRDALFGY